MNLFNRGDVKTTDFGRMARKGGIQMIMNEPVRIETNHSREEVNRQFIAVRSQLTDWYNLLDGVDKPVVDAMMDREDYGQVYDKYYTYPGFPTAETIKNATEKG